MTLTQEDEDRIREICRNEIYKAGVKLLEDHENKVKELKRKRELMGDEMYLQWIKAENKAAGLDF